MPSGHVHRISTLAIMPLAGAAAGYGASVLGQQAGIEDGLRAGLACALGVLFTLVVNPDLDLLDSSFKSKLRKKTLFAPWWLVWYPYSSSLNHRSPYSHWPVLGTFLRVIYILLIISLVVAALLAAELISPEQIFEIQLPRWFILWFVAGMVASDSFHWLLDNTT